MTSMFIQNLDKDLSWGDEMFGILSDMIRIETFPINRRKLNYFSKLVSNYLIRNRKWLSLPGYFNLNGTEIVTLLFTIGVV